eukprot:Rmarinus@m.8688
MATWFIPLLLCCAPTIVVASVDVTDFPSTPVMYYSFSEGSGSTALDSSGNSYDATIVDGSWDSSDCFDSAACLLFDRENTHVSVPVSAFANLETENVITISFWAKQTSPCDTHEIPFEGYNDTIRVTVITSYLLASESTLYFLTGGDYENYEDVATLDGLDCTYVNDAWHYWSFIFDGASNMKWVYKDAELILSNDNAYINLVSLSSFYIGTNNGHTFGGYIDEFVVFLNALSAEQIRDSMALYDDADECTEAVHDCDSSVSSCINTYGSFICSCYVGFYGDGMNCVACAANATSSLGSNTQSTDCVCNTGFIGDGVSACVENPFPVQPASYFSFSEGSGTSTFDSTSNKYEATINGPEWTTSDCFQSTSCLMFDYHDVMKIPLPALGTTTLNAFTIFFWFKPNDNCNNGNVFFMGHTSYYDSEVVATGFVKSYVQFETGDGTGSYDYSSLYVACDTISDDWHYWTFVFDGATDTQLVYKDAELILSKTDATLDLGRIDTFVLGYEHYWNGYYFEGMVDEFLVFSEALEESDIVQTRNFYDYFECSNGIHDCDPNATCTNTLLSFTCTCNANYYGTGTECTACAPGGVSPAGSTSDTDCYCESGDVGIASLYCYENPFPSSPVVYYPLFEGSGTTATDASGNSYHSTFSSAYFTWLQSGCFGSSPCLYFPGRTISVPATALATLGSANAFTICFWAKAASTCDASVFQAFEGYIYVYDLFNADLLDSGSILKFRTGDGSGLMKESKLSGLDCSYVADDWHHWTFVFNGSQDSQWVYKDGEVVLYDSEAVLDLPDTDVPNAGLSIGYGFYGSISEFLLFVEPFSAAAVLETYLSYDESDECASDIDDCDNSATCTNTYGSFTCACTAGYYGDGTSCTPCASQASAPANSLFATSCECNAGYLGDGYS